MRPCAGQASAELTRFPRRSTTSGATDREYLCQPEFSLARSFLLGGSGGSSFRGGSLGAGDCSCFVDFSFRHVGQSPTASQLRNTGNPARQCPFVRGEITS